MTTLHTYPDPLTNGGRLAATDWETDNPAGAVAATLSYDHVAIILAVTNRNGYRVAIGHAPGGLAA